MRGEIHFIQRKYSVVLLDPKAAEIGLQQSERILPDKGRRQDGAPLCLQRIASERPLLACLMVPEGSGRPSGVMSWVVMLLTPRLMAECNPPSVAPSLRLKSGPDPRFKAQSMTKELREGA